MFWTMHKSHGLPEVTLCEHHALEATNVGCSLFGLGPYETMAAAALELETITAIFGAGQDGFGFTSSEVGHCGACEDEAAESHIAKAGDAA